MVIAALTAAQALVASAVPAHSLLLAATPAPGATLAAAPPQVRLRFNNRVEAALSGLRLVDGRGTSRALPLRPAEGPDRLTADLPALPAGAYRLEWQVLSTDGHVVRGSFPFQIGP